MVARFDGRNHRAERWLLTQSSSLITEVSESTKDAVRIRVEAGMKAGRNPRDVALDIVGRLDRKTGQRIGGVVGLHSMDEAAARRAFEQLTSGDPAEMAKYLRRKTRNKRYDGIVMRAIKAKKPVPVDQARKMQALMEQKLLFNRGERIARTELLQSLHQAQDEAMEQLIDAGKIEERFITRTWDASEDSFTRATHRAADGQERGPDGYFRVGGYRMKHPGDASMGAPAKEIISCRCVVKIDIDHLGLMQSRGLDDEE